MKAYRFALFLLTFLVCPLNANGEPNEEQDSLSPDDLLVTLQQIDSDSVMDPYRIIVRLDQNPKWNKLNPIRIYDSYLELKLPGTIAQDPGKIYDMDNPFISKMGIYQTTPSETSIRIYPSNSYTTDVISKYLKIYLSGSMISIEIPKAHQNSINKLSDSDNLVGPPQYPQTLSASTIIANTKVNSDVPPPSEIIKRSSQNESNSLNKMLSSIATVGAFLFFLIILSSLVTWLFKKRKTSSENNQIITLKTLASLPLAPKQKLSLIQVGNENILIGITSESISFLTNISTQNIQKKNQIGNINPRNTSSRDLQKNYLENQNLGRIQNTEDTNFSRHLITNSSSLHLNNPPRLKNLPGNDEVTLSQPPTQKRIKPQQSDDTLNPTNPAIISSVKKNINIAISDRGIENLSKNKLVIDKNSNHAHQASIDDVTKIIREKLRNFKSL